MFTYSVSDRWLLCDYLDKKFVVESASVKKDSVFELLNTCLDTVMIVKFSNPSISNENFVHGSYVEDISLYGYKCLKLSIL